MKRRGYIYIYKKQNTWGEIRATNAELIVKHFCVCVWVAAKRGGYRPSISRHFRAPNILTLTFKFMWSYGLGGHGSLPFESSAVQVFSYISGSLLNSLKWVNSDSEDVNKLHRCYIWDLTRHASSFFSSSISPYVWVLIQHIDLCLFLRLQSLLSLSLFYPSILPSSSCLFKSRAGGRVPEGISLSNMKSTLLWV